MLDIESIILEKNKTKGEHSGGQLLPFGIQNWSLLGFVVKKKNPTIC